MNSLEINEKSPKNQGDILTKFYISQLLISLEYQTCYQNNAMTKYSHIIVKHEKNLICLFMNINENPLPLGVRVHQMVLSSFFKFS